MTTDPVNVEGRIDTEFALEQARCAYCNLNNVVKMNPGLGRHPIYMMAKAQLRDAIKALGDDSFCDLEDAL